MQPKDVVKVSQFWFEWSSCVSFKHQRDALYRFGKFEPCDKEWDDIWTAVQAKFSNDRDRAVALMESTHRAKSRQQSTTLGVIWEAKDPPSWD